MLHTILGQFGITPDSVQVIQFSPEDLTTQLRAAKIRCAAGHRPGRRQDHRRKPLPRSRTARSRRHSWKSVHRKRSSSRSRSMNRPRFRPASLAARGRRKRSRPSALPITSSPTGPWTRRLPGDFTRWAVRAKQALGGDIPAFTRIEGPDTDKAASLAVHPGALAYLEGEQRPSSTVTATRFTGA